MSMNIEAEIRDLKRRVGELEGSFGFLSEQVKGVHKDVLAFEAGTEQRFKKVDERFDRLENKIDGLDRKIDAKVDGLTNSLPGIVRDALTITRSSRRRNNDAQIEGIHPRRQICRRGADRTCLQRRELVADNVD